MSNCDRLQGGAWRPRAVPHAEALLTESPAYPAGSDVTMHITSDVPVERVSTGGTAFDALKTELREQERHRLLKEINGWLLDQAEADDVDGAEYDADFCRKIARDLAEHFKPC